MLKQLLQSLENNKPLEDILRERLSLKDKDILLLQKENLFYLTDFNSHLPVYVNHLKIFHQILPILIKHQAIVPGAAKYHLVLFQNPIPYALNQTLITKQVYIISNQGLYSII